MKKIFTTLVSVFVLLVLPIYSLAQSQDSGIQISPLTYNYDIDPGGSKDSQITLKNLGDEEIEYTIETENFTATTDDGAPVFNSKPSVEGVTSLADWFDFPDGRTAKIPAKGSTEINFSVSVPEGAEPGGHYAAVFAKVVGKTEEGKTELGVSSRVGTLFLVNVPGDVRYGVEIEDLTVPTFIWKGPVDLKMKIRNSGNVHYDSQAEIALRRLVISGESKVDMGAHTVIPDSSRAYEGRWESKYPFGIYRVTASATGGEASPATKVATVYAIPLIVVIPLIAIIAVITMTIRFLRRKYRVVSK